MKHMFSILLILIIGTFNVFARSQIRRVGSATILPSTQEITTSFAKETGNFSPLLTSNGTGVGIKQFCTSGMFAPDIVDASRTIRKEELEVCFKNGITQITKLTIGKNGLCLLHSQKILEDKKISNFSLTPMQVYKAMIKEIATEDGKLTPNPYKNWNDIDPNLPKAPINIRIPSTTHGTRGEFETLILEPNCDVIPWLKDLKKSNPKKYEKICYTLRQDEHVKIMQDFELAENGNVLVDQLTIGSLGEIVIAGCNIYVLHPAQIKALSVNNIEATIDNFKNGSYPLMYSLQMYFNKAHFKFVKGLEEFLNFYNSPNVLGPTGTLSKHGIVPVESSNPITEITPDNPIT